MTPRKSGYGHRTRTRSPALNISYPLGRHLRGRIVKIGQPTVVLTSIADVWCRMNCTNVASVWISLAPAEVQAGST